MSGSSSSDMEMTQDAGSALHDEINMISFRSSGALVIPGQATVPQRCAKEFPCILCRELLRQYEGDRPQPWETCMRALYLSRDGKVNVSGLGLLNPLGDAAGVIAPLEVDRSWEHAPCPSLAIFSRERVYISESPGLPGLSICLGVGFHDNCWQLVSRVCRPQSPPLSKLFKACMSRAVQRDEIGVAFEFEVGSNKLFSIGEGKENLVTKDRQNDRWPRVWDPTHTSCVYTEPNRVDFISDDALERFLHIAVRFGRKESPGPPVERLPDAALDCFAALPLELRIRIATCLSIKAFFNLRRASLAFAPVFYMQCYWASLFRTNAKWGFVSGLRTPHLCHDWRTLYKNLFYYLMLSPEMLKRLEIWKLAESMADATELEWATDVPYVGTGLDQTTLARGSTISYHSQRSRALGFLLLNRPQSISQTYNLTYKQHIHIPRTLEAIRIWHRMIGCVKYITGISFITDTGDITRLGYFGGPGHEWVQVNGRPITGILTRVGERCFESLSFYTRVGGEHILLGESAGSFRPETARLLGNTPITALELGFDEFQLVELTALRDYQETIRDYPETIPLQLSPKYLGEQLRAGALWYPEIPERHKHIQGATYDMIFRQLLEFHPIVWEDLGGVRGEKLKNLVSIRVIHQQAILCLRFDYREDDCDWYSCLTSSELTVQMADRFSRRGKLDRADEENHTEFKIDGKAGEYLTTVYAYKCKDISVSSSAEGNSGNGTSEEVAVIRFETNFGQSHMLGPPSSVELARKLPQSEFKLCYEEGSTITGLYATRFGLGGIIDFGLITEFLGDERESRD